MFTLEPKYSPTEFLRLGTMRILGFSRRPSPRPSYISGKHLSSVKKGNEISKSLYCLEWEGKFDKVVP